MSIKNTGDSDDKLVGAESPAAVVPKSMRWPCGQRRHENAQADDGIVIPAGQTVELKPGGLHMMFLT